MYKAEKPRDANKACVKDNLKDSEDLTKNKHAVIGIQSDYASFSQRCYSSRILDWYKPSSFEFSQMSCNIKTTNMCMHSQNLVHRRFCK